MRAKMIAVWRAKTAESARLDLGRCMRFSSHAHQGRMLLGRAFSQRAQRRRVNATKFLTELKRRNVYRAAVAYGVVAWFLTQLTTQVFPFFEIPNSAVRFVVIALVIGFPIAMLLSWVYEFTPEGVVRTEDLRPAQAISAERVTGRILDFIIIGALLLVIAMLIDAVAGPAYEENLASVEVKVGDKNRAILRLQLLLEIPYVDCLTPALLRL